jgi:hypothetical protein
LNRRPADYESAALPTELGWPRQFLFYQMIDRFDKRPHHAAEMHPACAAVGRCSFARMPVSAYFVPPLQFLPEAGSGFHVSGILRFGERTIREGVSGIIGVAGMLVVIRKSPPFR